MPLGVDNVENTPTLPWLEKFVSVPVMREAGRRALLIFKQSDTRGPVYKPGAPIAFVAMPTSKLMLSVLFVKLTLQPNAAGSRAGDVACVVFHQPQPHRVQS